MCLLQRLVSRLEIIALCIISGKLLMVDCNKMETLLAAAGEGQLKVKFKNSGENKQIVAMFTLFANRL